MVFGWFSKPKEGEDKRISKAHKLEAQDRWAEALSYYEEILEECGSSEEARQGARTCREKLVTANLEEARAFQTSDPEKAREHARLALDLAGREEDLRALAQAVLGGLPGKVEPPRPKPVEAPSRLFEPSCACPAPCAEDCAEAEADVDEEDLFALYLEAADPEERAAFEALGPAFQEGYVLLQQGDLAAARETLQAALRDEPEPSAVHYALGLLEGLEGNLAEAEGCFRKSLEAAAGFAPAARHRSAVLNEMGRGDEAVASLEGWLKAHPKDGEARLLLGGLFLDAGDPGGAQREAEEARRHVVAGDLRPGLLSAAASRRSGDREGALRILQGLVAQRPTLLDALVPMGELLMEEGGASAERAAEVFKRCYQLDPDRGWWYLLRVAEAYGAGGWKDEARDVLGRAGSELPDSPEAREAWEAVERKLA